MKQLIILQFYKYELSNNFIWDSTKVFTQLEFEFLLNLNSKELSPFISILTQYLKSKWVIPFISILTQDLKSKGVWP